MRQEFSDRLRILIREKFAGSCRDGWVYGRLKQEFDLQPDELNAMAIALRFKRGWNPGLKDILEGQWQKDEVEWIRRERNKAQTRLSREQEKYRISRELDALLQSLKNSDML